MAKLNTNLEKSEYMAKFPIGPAKPKAGPTLPIQVKTELTVVSKSRLSKETKKIQENKINIKQPK